MEMKRIAQERGESSGAEGYEVMWKTLWKIQVPPVLRNFSWKMCNNLLPTKDNLFRKKSIPDPTCPLCLREPETIFHCIWGCPAAVAVWQECRRPLQKLSC
jgi:hypothetical protein